MIQPDIVVQLNDYAMLNVVCEPGVAREISEYFSFFVEGYKFMPAYKNRRWDGKIRLFNMNTRQLNAGLYDKLRYFATQRNYTFECKGSKYGRPDAGDNNISVADVDDYCGSIGIPFRPHDYQLAAVTHAIQRKRTVLLSPTGSGKSLMIYCMMKWYMDNRKHKILVIVPTVGLVNQMQSDFADYGMDVEKETHVVYSGKDKDTSKRIVISTWQSIYKLHAKWFEQFGCIFGDECHGFKAKSLSTIMNKARFAEYRIGTTGTLDGTQTHEWVLEGLFGPVHKVTTTKQLQEDDKLAPLMINVLKLNYSDNARKQLGKVTYQQEIDFLVTNEKRSKFIINLATGLQGNTLVLFQLVERHGKQLFDGIHSKAGSERKTFYVHGNVDANDREAIRAIVEKQKDAIIVASLGTFSTGINIRNLHNIIFASPSKSQIRVLQSIGRGLRKSDDGRVTQLYDIVDDLSWNNSANYALKHSAERVRMYDDQQFTYKLINVQL
jgi:superfamily II DNA or RNA helicase